MTDGTGAKDGSEPKGKPEAGSEPEDGGEPDGSGSEEAEDEAGDGASGGGQQKVAPCHKGEAPISVGAPAQRAHLRSGDSPGACDARSAGSEGGTKAADEPKGAGGGLPGGKGRPDGAGKPDDAGEKPGGPRGRGRGNGAR